MTRPTRRSNKPAGSKGGGIEAPAPETSVADQAKHPRSDAARRRLLARGELQDEVETWVNEGGAGDDVSR